MSRYIIRRFLLMIPTLLIVSLVVFTLMRLTPGDPVSVMLGEERSEQAYNEQRAKLGLDLPIPAQYVIWLGRAVQADLGRSLRDDAPVIGEIFDRLPATIELALTALLISLIISVPLGIISALRPNSKIDGLVSGISLLGISIPNFLLAVLLILFLAYYIRLFKPDGYVPPGEDLGGNIQRLILPAITLGAAGAALNMRLIRSSVLEVLSQDYVRTARAKGLRQALIMRRHVIRNALIPIVTVIGLQFGALLEGAVITETIFSWPGIGQLAVTSLNSRDYPVVQGVVLFGTLVYTTINLLIDISYAYIDPRISYG